MYTAYVYERETKPVVIESYPTLEAAVADLVEMGWEDDAERLLACPIAIYGPNDRLAATVTYSENLTDQDSPYLHVHRTGWPEVVKTYRRIDVANGYTAQVRFHPV